HRLACGLEDAGWEIYDTLMWMYGSGFPKSYNIAKGIEGKALLGTADWSKWNELDGEKLEGRIGYHKAQAEQGYRPRDYTEKERVGKVRFTTPAAQTWDGYGTALKPAYEPIILARKPRGKTYQECAVEGALWIDGCRVGAEAHVVHGKEPGKFQPGGGKTKKDYREVSGRWPANVILDEQAAAMLDEQSGVSGGKLRPANARPRKGWMLGEVNGTSNAPDNYGDTGGASRYFKNLNGAARFFYTAKASRSERNAGLEGFPEKQGFDKNTSKVIQRRDPDTGQITTSEYKPSSYTNFHPTVKPLALTEYLARLIRPPEEYLDDAVILIPFCGSGSEVIGAIKAGWRHWLGIEISEEYAEIARARIAYWQGQVEADRLGRAQMEMDI
nr:site-specific DNA-methyltransferase [Chloroflexota bacterium]